MKVFISWSGEYSELAANALSGWLKKVIQAVEPWISGSEISPGERWNLALASALEETDMGILCLTRSNLRSPWLLFEAGSLAKSMSGSRVIPYLLDFEESELLAPLTQFQSMKADREGTWKIVKMMHRLGNTGIDDAEAEEIFNVWWPHLEEELDTIRLSISEAPAAPKRSDRELLEETLALIRDLSRESKSAGVAHFGSIERFLQSPIVYHEGRRDSLLAERERIVERGETPSGRYEDWADESEWLIGKIESALSSFQKKIDASAT